MKYITQFTIRRGNLPHWQSPGSVYFITFRTYNNQILDEHSRRILYKIIINYSKTMYALYAFTIMPDHVHIILQPNEIRKNEYIDLFKILQAIKGFSAKQIIKHYKEISIDKENKIWQKESFDRIIRNDKELIEKMNYILNNAFNKDIVKNSYDYEWLWYIGIDDKK